MLQQFRHRIALFYVMMKKGLYSLTSFLEVILKRPCGDQYFLKVSNLIFHSVKQKTHFLIKYIGAKMCYFIPYFMQYFLYCKIKKYINLPLLPRFAYILVLLLGFHLLITFLPFRCLFFKRLFYIFFLIFNDTIKVD